MLLNQLWWDDYLMVPHVNVVETDTESYLDDWTTSELQTLVNWSSWWNVKCTVCFTNDFLRRCSFCYIYFFNCATVQSQLNDMQNSSFHFSGPFSDRIVSKTKYSAETYKKKVKNWLLDFKKILVNLSLLGFYFFKI